MNADMLAWARLLEGAEGLSRAQLESQIAVATQEGGSDADDRPMYLDLRPTDRPNPFSYQSELVDQILSVYEEDDKPSALLALPTGGGKTVTAGRAIVRLLRAERARRILWAAPSIELLDQARSTISRLWTEDPSTSTIRLSLIRGGSEMAWSREREILFVTTQLLTSRVAGRTSSLPVKPDLVVVDEAHYAGAPRLSEALERFLANGVRLIGLSATPGRTGEEGLDRLLGIFERRLLTAPSLGADPVSSLQDRGILSSLHFHLMSIPSALPGLSRQRVGGRGPSVDQLIKNRARFEASLTAVEEAVQLGRALVFCHNLLHACTTTVALERRGFRVGMLSGASGAAYRQNVLDGFENGRLDTLVNIRVLTTGYDFPRLPSVVITMPIESPILYEQVVGRVARGKAAGGTSEGHVWQLDDHLRMHGLPKSYHRFWTVGWKLSSPNPKLR